VAVAVAGFSRGAARIAVQGQAVATFFRGVWEAELVRRLESVRLWAGVFLRGRHGGCS
jgi:hypothetical protein